MLEAMKSLRDEMHSLKKQASESEVVQTSDSLTKAGPSKQPDPNTRISISTTQASDHSDVQPMDTDHYRPPLPPKSTQGVQSEHTSKLSDLESGHLDPHSESEQPKRMCPKVKKHSDKKKHKVRAKYYSQRKISPLYQSKSQLKLNTRLLPSLSTYRIAQIQFSRHV